MTASYTVPAASLLCMGASLLLSLGVPVVLAVLCGRRRKSAWRAVAVGVICFWVGVLMLEGSVNQLVTRVFFPGLMQSPAALIAYGALAAGLFEEGARLVGLRLLCKRPSDTLTGFAYGVGHGGFEAVSVGALGMINNLVTAAMLNAGGAETLLAGVPAEQQALAQSQLSSLCTLPAATFLASGVERMTALALHIALSVLVWMVVTGHLPAWCWAVAVLLHAGADVVPGLYQTGVLANVWLTELLVLAYTAAVCCGVWRLWRKTAKA